MTTLQSIRSSYQLSIPPLLQQIKKLYWEEAKSSCEASSSVKSLFPLTANQPLLVAKASGESLSCKPLRVGVVFSGGPASGGHNVIVGLYDALCELHPESKLVGFLNGPKGILEGEYKEIERDFLGSYRNSGGFDLLGSGRFKIETEEHFEQALQQLTELQIKALVVIGGDDSNTNAALLAEYFRKKGSAIAVIGIPKTIDGDLRNAYVEISFGFDTASKLYSELIGNIGKDALSARKYYHFVRLMGRSASHIVLECALKTQPNLALIAEEVADKQQTLSQIVAMIVDLICEREEQGKSYGVILIPEGIVESIAEIKVLVEEINALLAQEGSSEEEKIASELSPVSKQVFLKLPPLIREQFLLKRDAHGNVQVSAIETERLLIELVKEELKSKKISFSAVNHFFGYEGRSCFPSNFDCTYGYALGRVAASLVQADKSGYMAAVGSLTHPVEQWTAAAVPLVSLMQEEKRKGKVKPVIAKALVKRTDPAFLAFEGKREQWRLEDCYLTPGPIQFSADPSLTDSVPLTVSLNHQE